LGLDGLLLTLLGRRAAEAARDAGPLVWIALGVTVGFLKLNGLLPALLGLRAVEAAEEGLRALRLLPG